MKKVILFLFSLVLTSQAFSQAEGYLERFEQPSLITTKVWKISDNRCFKANGEIYVLAYEPFESDLTKNIRDKDLYLYRKDSTSVKGWVKASLLIRHDYFHWSNGYPDSLQALDAHVRRTDEECYGSIKIELNGIVTIELKTLVWKKGEPIIHDEYSILTLYPRGKDYNFILKIK